MESNQESLPQGTRLVITKPDPYVLVITKTALGPVMDLILPIVFLLVWPGCAIFSELASGNPANSFRYFIEHFFGTPFNWDKLAEIIGMFCVILPPAIISIIGFSDLRQLVKVLTVGESFTFDGLQGLLLMNNEVIGNLKRVSVNITDYRHTWYRLNISLWDGSQYKTITIGHRLSKRFANSIADEIHRVLARRTYARAQVKSEFFLPIEGFSSQEQELNPGDIAIWCKQQLPLGGFRGPRVTILGRTNKRVKIEVVENGESQIKYVKPEKLILEKYTRKRWSH